MNDLLQQTPSEILAGEASKDAAEAFVLYRKGQGKKFHLTARAARMIAKSLREIKLEGGDPDEALDLAQERAWTTMRPDWYWKTTGKKPKADKPQSQTVNEQMQRDAENIKSGKPYLCTSISHSKCMALLKAELVTREDLRKVGK